MRAIRCLFIISLLVRASASVVIGDEAVSATPTTPQQYTGAERGNFLLIRDPLPLMQRILQSKNVRTVIRGIPAMPPVDELEALLSEVGEDRIPDQITIAASSGEMAHIASMAKAALLSDFCSSAVEAGLSEQLDDMQAQLLLALEDIRAPQIDVWVRFRSEDMAIALETQLRALVAELLLEDTIEIEFEKDRVLAAMSVADFIPATILRGTLFTQNLADDLSDPDLVSLADRVASLNIQFLFRREGATLHLSMGPRGIEPSAVSDDLNDRVLWRDSEEDFVYGDLRLESLLQTLGDVVELWTDLKDTNLGKAIRETATPESDPEDLVYIHEQLQQEKGHIEFRVTIPNSSSECFIEVLESTSSNPIALQQSELLQFLPSDAAAWMSDSDRSPVDLLRVVIDRLEENLEPEDVETFDDPVLRILSRRNMEDQQKLQQIKAAYYLQYGGLRQLLRTDSQAAFRPHVLAVVGSGLAESSMEATFLYGEKENSIRIESLSMPQFCMVTAITDRAELNKLAGQFVEEIQKLKPTTDTPVYLRETTVDQLDGTVWYFTEDLCKSLLPYGMTLKLSPDCTPHFLVLDDRWLLLSNSLPLTRQMVRARKDEAARKVMPQNAEDQNMRNLLTRDAFQKSLLAPMQWVDLLARNKLKISATGYFAEGLVDGLKENDNVRSLLPRTLRMARELSSFIEDLEMQRTTRDGVHRTITKIRFLP